jgi:hypothetical protein
MKNFPHHLESFFEMYKREDIIELYNEPSVYFRLGNHLENLFNVDYKIQFWRELKFFGIEDTLVKPFIDIAIFDDDMDTFHAVEVVYIKDEPQVEKMFEICRDLRFMEQMVKRGWQECYVLLVADIPKQQNDQLHYLFRGETILEGMMQKPQETQTVIQLDGSYTIEWIEVDDHMHYATILIQPIN